MDRSLFAYILRHSRPQQIWLTLVICLYFPIQYVSLELPKLIIDDAIGADGQGPYPVQLLGLIQFQIDVSQLNFLWILCGTYLFFVVLNNALKYYINVYIGRLAERMLRRMRYELFQRILCFPVGHFRRASPSEIIPMVTQELEPVGGFAGVAFSEPIYKGGMLLVLLGFMVAQDVILGLAAISLFPLQIWLIPRLQARVNRLNKKRVREVRRLAEQIGETVTAVAEIRANDAIRHERARFTARLAKIYWIRYDIYLQKYLIKFINNFIDKLTPFFFFAIGGWLVLEGQVTIGALTGVLLAYKDVSTPWKELLAWYQQKEDARIKYEQVISQFDPPGLRPPHSLDEAPPETFDAQAPIIFSKACLEDEGGGAILQPLDLELETSRPVIVLGQAGSGRQEFALLLAGQMRPSAGTVTWAALELNDLPPSALGRELAYVSAQPVLATGTVADNLAFGLRHDVVSPASLDGGKAARRARELLEARAAGNSEDDVDAFWLDMERAGVENRSGLARRAIQILRLVELDDDVYRLGLRGTVDLTNRPELAQKILLARRALHDKLDSPAFADLVEPFEENAYNTNASIAENLLFGAPMGPTFQEGNLARQPFLRALLREIGLDEELMRVGRNLAETMLELFADLPPGHEFFARYSFIAAEDLPSYQDIVKRSAKGLRHLDGEEQDMLFELPLRLIPAQHRLGLISDRLKARILEARKALRERLPGSLREEIAFFNADEYNPGASVQDNILFGKPVQSQAGAAQQIGNLIGELLDAMNLRDAVIEVGLSAHVGVAGARLGSIQRQKLALARAIVRRPRVLVVDEALSSLPIATQLRLAGAILRERDGHATIWLPAHEELAQAGFVRLLRFDQGHLDKDMTLASASQAPPATEPKEEEPQP